MEVKIHELKTDYEVFWEIYHGRKTCEFRKNDRNFNIYDLLLLRQHDYINKKYANRNIIAQITHIVPSGHYGIPDGYCMLSIKIMHKWDGEY